MKDHPLLLISNIIPIEYEELSGEFLDKLHLVLSATNIYHAENRDDIFRIVREILVPLELVSIVEESSPKKVRIKQGNLTKRILEEYVSKTQ